ncbi:MAG TPA: DUF5789 family protein [Halobacteriales archaeon]|nr:DUF5789 family protein [Halobacteriales archaeon]
MGEVKLSELESVLAELSYPVSKRAAVEELDDVTLLYADGEEDLEAVLERVNTEYFESWQDLSAEIYNHLPTEAVGEPGQSEGEG